MTYEYAPTLCLSEEEVKHAKIEGTIARIAEDLCATESACKVSCFSWVTFSLISLLHGVEVMFSISTKFLLISSFLLFLCLVDPSPWEVLKKLSDLPKHVTVVNQKHAVTGSYLSTVAGQPNVKKRKEILLKDLEAHSKQTDKKLNPKNIKDPRKWLTLAFQLMIAGRLKMIEHWILRPFLTVAENWKYKC